MFKRKTDWKKAVKEKSKEKTQIETMRFSVIFGKSYFLKP